MPVLDEYYPFDVGFGATANAARWRKMAQLWQSDGVIAGYLNTLTPTSLTVSGGTVSIQSGGLFIHGYYGEVNPGPAAITVGTNGTIVAWVDTNPSSPTYQTANIDYIDGVVDYGTGGYEQDANKWQIPLWLVSGTSLIDLRTIINPGAGCGWWNGSATPISVASGATVEHDFLTLRVPYPGLALMRGELLITFTDASALQTASCQLMYQHGQTDQQQSAVMEPALPGGAAAQPCAVPVSMSELITVTQGKKEVGWLVTAGSGPGITMSTMTASVTMLNHPASA